MNQRFTATIVTFLASSAVHAQLFINEIFENPPGAGYAENQWEFIELYGRPGMHLDGYALLVLKGGIDDDRNGFPEVLPHVDEVFILDGLRVAQNGLVCLVNTDPVTGHSILTASTSGETDFIGRTTTSASETTTFQQVGADPSRDEPRLDHDGSSTYMLIRNTHPRLLRTVLAPGVEHDLNFDGRIDCFSTAASAEPRFQIVDLLSWSNRGGKEYGWLPGYEISETHGINPDALSRIAFFVEPPSVGSRTKDRRDHTGRVVGFILLPTSMADESFVYGVLDSSAFPKSLEYYAGSDLDGWPQLKAPTDISAMPFEIREQDPEPDNDPFPGHVRRSVNGVAMLWDLDFAGFGLTPGALNDLPKRGLRQQRLVPGDLDFDGDVDQTDVSIAEALIGASIDDRVNGEFVLDSKWQGGPLQRLLALVELSDDAEGEDRTATSDDAGCVRELSRQTLSNRP